jgi:putative SOS response-associated peptidase YedK
MCGRYRLSRRKQLLAEYFDAEYSDLDWEPRYNIAPTQPVATVRQIGAGRMLSNMRWGLIPYWAKDTSIGDAQGKIILSHEELSLLLGGIDLTKTKHKRWYRKASPEGHAAA